MDIPEIINKLKHEKADDPFAVFERYYKSFYFPGFGQFKLGLYPKNFLYPSIAILLLLIIASFGFISNKSSNISDSLDRISKYNLSSSDEKRKPVLIRDTHVNNLILTFEQVSGMEENTTYSTTVIAGLNSILESNKDLRSRKEKLELDYLQTYNEKIEEQKGGDESEIIRERDKKIESGLEKLDKQADQSYIEGPAKELMAFVLGQNISIADGASLSFQQLLSNYSHTSSINSFKFIYIPIISSLPFFFSPALLVDVAVKCAS